MAQLRLVAHRRETRKAMPNTPESSDRKLPTAAVCKRYSISRRALCRWMTDPKSGLPASIVLAGRHYWNEADLIAWERANITKKVA